MYNNWLGDNTYSLHFLVRYEVPPGLAASGQTELKMFFVCEELYEHEMNRIGDWWSLQIPVSRALDIKSLHYMYELRDTSADDTDSHSRYDSDNYNAYQQHHCHHHHHHHHSSQCEGSSSSSSGGGSGSSGSDYGSARGHYDIHPTMLARGSNVEIDEDGERSSYGKYKGELSVSSLETTTSELISRIKEQARPRSNVVDYEFKAGGCRSSAREFYLEELPHDCTVIEVRDRWIEGDNGEDSYLRTNFFATLFSTPQSTSPGFDPASIPVSSSTAIPDDPESPTYRSQFLHRQQLTPSTGASKDSGNNNSKKDSHHHNSNIVTFVGLDNDNEGATNNSSSNKNNNNNNNNEEEEESGENVYGTTASSTTIGNDSTDRPVGCGSIQCAISGTDIVYEDEDDDDNDNEEEEEEGDEESTGEGNTNTNYVGAQSNSGSDNDNDDERCEKRSLSIPAVRAFRRRRFTVTFKVLCTCLNKDEEEVRVAGSLPSLGGWSVSGALPMTCEEYPVWTATLDLSASSFDNANPDTKGFSFEYKYLIAPRRRRGLYSAHYGTENSFSPADSPSMTPAIGEHGSPSPTGARVLWETCDNRCFTGIADSAWGGPGNSGDDSGMHDVTVTVNDTPFEQPPWRGVGLSVDLTSLRSESNLGLGEFPDIKTLVDWAANAGFSYIQLAPLNDLAGPQDPLCTNTNAPISVFAFDPVFLRLDDVSGTPEANSEIERIKARCSNAQEQMKYKDILNAKMLVLALIYESRASFVRSDPEYSTFLDANRMWLEPYARYKIKHWTPIRGHLSSFSSSSSSSQGTGPSLSSSSLSSTSSSASVTSTSGPSGQSLPSNQNALSGSVGNSSSGGGGGNSSGGNSGGGSGLFTSGRAAAAAAATTTATATPTSPPPSSSSSSSSAPPEEFFYMVQWFLHLQLLEASQYASSRRIALHIEMPFFVHPDGVDYHENPSLFYPTSGPDGIYASRLPSEAGTALTGGSYTFVTPLSALPASVKGPGANSPSAAATVSSVGQPSPSPSSGSSSASAPAAIAAQSSSSSSSGPGIGPLSSAAVAGQVSSTPMVVSTTVSSLSARLPGPMKLPTTSSSSSSSSTSALPLGSAGPSVSPSGAVASAGAVGSGTPGHCDEDGEGGRRLLTMLSDSSRIHFPVPKWEAHQDQEFQWYVMRLEHLSQYFQGVCFKDVMNYFRIWTVPAYSDDPMYGAFVPHVPVEPFEVELAGVKHVESLCRPLFTRQAVASLFGPDANKALEDIAECVGEGSGGYYTLKPEFLRPGGAAEKSLPLSYTRALRDIRRYYTLFRREEEGPKKKKRSRECAAKHGHEELSCCYDNASGSDSNDNTNNNISGSYGNNENDGADDGEDRCFYERECDINSDGKCGIYGIGNSNRNSNSNNNNLCRNSNNRGLIPLPVFTEPLCPVLDDFDRNTREMLQSIHREYYFGSRSTVLWENTGRTVLEQIVSSTQMLVTAEAADLRLIPEWCRLGLAASGIALHSPLWVHETAVRSTPVLSVAATSSLSFAPLREWWRECRNERFKKALYTDKLWLGGEPPARCTQSVVSRAVEKTLEKDSLLALLPLQDVLALKSEYAGEKAAAGQDDSRYTTPVTVNELARNESFAHFLRTLFEQAGRSYSGRGRDVLPFAPKKPATPALLVPQTVAATATVSPPGGPSPPPSSSSSSSSSVPGMTQANFSRPLAPVPFVGIY